MEHKEGIESRGPIRGGREGEQCGTLGNLAVLRARQQQLPLLGPRPTAMPLVRAECARLRRTIAVGSHATKREPAAPDAGAGGGADASYQAQLLVVVHRAALRYEGVERRQKQRALDRITLWPQRSVHGERVWEPHAAREHSSGLGLRLGDILHGERVVGQLQVFDGPAVQWRQLDGNGDIGAVVASARPR